MRLALITAMATAVFAVAAADTIADAATAQSARKNVQSWYEQGLRHMKKGTRRNHQAAARLFRMAAEQGHAGARSNLGYCYAEGLGVDRNNEEAVRWWRLAAEQGYAEAECNLGLCYGGGIGVKRDYVESVRWLRRAADRGLARAQYHLGACHAGGMGVPRNLHEAAYWYRLAADQDDEKAVEALVWICRDNRDIARINKPVLEKAASSGHRRAGQILKTVR